MQSPSRQQSNVVSGRDLKLLMDAIRAGDIRYIQEHLTTSKHHLNAVDEFDYSPIVLASLCGHYDILVLLLALGARCDRESFQGERAVYSALNDRIRNLLLKYDYSISIDNKQPFGTLVSSLWSKEIGCTSLVGILTPRPDGDIYIYLESDGREFAVHTFVLFARCPYFRRLISSTNNTEAKRYTITDNIKSTAIKSVLRYIYLVDADEILADGDIVNARELSLYFGLPALQVLSNSQSKDLDTRTSRRTATVEAAQKDFLYLWDQYLRNPLILARGMSFSIDQMDPRVKLLRPDVILQVESRRSNHSYFYGTHRAMLQSDFLRTAIGFKQKFQGSQANSKCPMLVSVDVSPDVMEAIVKWFYTDILDITPELALKLLLAADMLLIERLKPRACLLITAQDRDDLLTGEFGYSIFDVARTGWLTGVSSRLDPFCAKFLATRLERCLDIGPVRTQFEDLVAESANRIQMREETDTIEIVDDIRYYLNERFRMRFEALPEHMFSDELHGTDTAPGSRSQIPPHQPETLKTDEDEYEALLAGLDGLLARLGFDV